MAKGSKGSKAAKAAPSTASKRGAAKKDERSGDKSDERIASDVSMATQHRILNIFRDALEAGDNDTKILQEVKGHLYNRDFAAAFGKPEYLRVYALRWSAGRALGYLQIFSDIGEHPSSDHVEQSTESSGFKAVCLGGGAGAELVALAGWLSHRSTIARPSHLQLLDVADWTLVVDALRKGITIPPTLSKYASAGARDANVELLPPQALHCVFSRCNVLQLELEELQHIAGNADLITLMFTLNELYSTSVSKTQRLLTQLTDIAKPGSLLLVVDSPGSYSTVIINGTEKKYPMQWLLDHTMLGTIKGGSTDACKWHKVVSDDSRWFRLPSGLQYPIELENMRYQIHLYRRQSDETPD